MKPSMAITSLAPLVVVALLRAASADNVRDCCACLPENGDNFATSEQSAALICAEILSSEQSAFVENCKARDGAVVCVAQASCDGAEPGAECLQAQESCVQMLANTGITCPVARAPVLGARPTVGLALLLGAGGFAVLSWRRRARGS